MSDSPVHGARPSLLRFTSNCPEWGPVMGDSHVQPRFRTSVLKRHLTNPTNTRSCGHSQGSPLSGLGISSLTGTSVISEHRRCPQFSLSLESHLSLGCRYYSSIILVSPGRTDKDREDLL